jgi:hypothetical protein
VSDNLTPAIEFINMLKQINDLQNGTHFAKKRGGGGAAKKIRLAQRLTREPGPTGLYVTLKGLAS